MDEKKLESMLKEAELYKEQAEGHLGKASDIVPAIDGEYLEATLKIQLALYKQNQVLIEYLKYLKAVNPPKGGESIETPGIGGAPKKHIY